MQKLSHLIFVALMSAPLMGCGYSPLTGANSNETAMVAIDFVATETFDAQQRQPYGYVSRMVQIEDRDGNIRFRREEDHMLRNGENTLQLTVGSTYALTHLAASGAFGAVYIFCGNYDLPAFVVNENAPSQAGVSIQFNARRSSYRVYSVETSVSPMPRDRGADILDAADIGAVSPRTIQPSSDCDPELKSNASRYRVPSFYSMIEINAR